ncbi:DUF4932 domain-containing protein [Chitinophaga sedimenti]|uniref:DUF4932 domain-containing protein n=1 Tax=Chitinophaga sedimenti TaxID=2033606 RepID=UPI002004A675|nr:DUF4932 domain-containing protein [Chitinophaga sedimenti]MCK7556508.1 DUF4932 domain-containing protein [Chitinophaga sedimenti]
MKLLSKLLLTTFFSLFVINTFAASAPRERFKVFRFEYGGVAFSVDPRIELYQAVVLASGMQVTNYVDIDYKVRVDQQMAKYKTHPLFDFTARHLKRNNIFKYIDAPITFLLHLDNNFEWRTDVNYELRNDPKIDSFRLCLKRFAEETDYIRFFNSNETFYSLSLRNLQFNLDDFNEKQRVLNYYGVKQSERNEFNLILNFLGWGNFGPRLITNKGREMYAVIAPQKSYIRIPTFDQTRLFDLVWHEFGHSFANPAVDKKPYADQLNALSHLHEPVREFMRQKAYHEWMSVVREHLTEAVACRLAAQKFGEDFAAQNIIRVKKGQNWTYLYPLLDALKEYEANRARYPTLESFMPRIVETFQKITQADIDKWIAAAADTRKPDVAKMPQIHEVFNKDSVLIILAAQEADTAGDRRFKEFIHGFIKQVPGLAKGKIITDGEVRNYDLGKYNLFVAGTPAGNAIVRKVMTALPIQLNENGIIGEKKYDGKGYLLMAGWVNPDNPQKIMTIITGLHPDDMLNFNHTPFGGSNYHIMKNMITYKMGEFKKSGGVWVCE